MGDPSDDGHGKTDDFIIETNLTRQELQSAYQNGSEMVGWDFVSCVAEGYEDNLFPLVKYERLQEFGNEIAYDRYENDVYVDRDTFARTYLFIAKLGNPELVWKSIPDTVSIDIGGYGLFW